MEYLQGVLKNFFQVLLLGVLPCLLLAVAMQYFSVVLRTRLAALVGSRIYIFLSAPGVAVHELGHAFFCKVFRHRIVEMKLFSPQPDGTLGYVTHSYDPKSRYQRIGNFFIGTGPIWFGAVFLRLASILLLPDDICGSGGLSDIIAAFFSARFWCSWTSWLWLYLFLTVGSHITLSPPDIDGAWEGGLSLLVAILICELVVGLNADLSGWFNGRMCAFFQGVVRQLFGVLLVLAVFAVATAIFIRRK